MSVVSAVRDKIRNNLSDKYHTEGVWMPGPIEGLLVCNKQSDVFASITIRSEFVQIIEYCSGQQPTDAILAQLTGTCVTIRLSDPDLFNKVEKAIDGFKR